MALTPKWAITDSVAIDALGANQYREADGSDNFSGGQDSGEVVRIYYVGWQYIPDFLDDLLGYSVNNNDGSLSRPSVPDQHWAFGNYFADKYSIEKVGPASQQSNAQKSPKYLTAKITVTYSPLKYYIFGDGVVTKEIDRFVSREFGYSGEFMTTNGGMKFVDTGTVLAQQPGKIIGLQEMTYTWHKVPANSKRPFIPPNNSKVTSCYGKVNSTYFDVKGVNYPPGTVLCQPPECRAVDPRIDTGSPDSNHYWEIVFKFLYKNNGSTASSSGTDYAGWNHLYNQATAQWEQVVSVLSGQPVYEYTDLNNLFTLDIMT